MYCIEQIGARAPDKTNLLFLPPVALPTVTSVISPLFIENLPTKIITAALKLQILKHIADFFKEYQSAQNVQVGRAPVNPRSHPLLPR